MSTTRGTISNAAKADAAHQAQVAEQWRDWHAYLQAQLQLLDAQQTEDSGLPSFERQTTSWEVQREQAEATLKRIPAARRAVFDAERDLRREEIQRDLEQTRRTSGTAGQSGVLDADLVDRELLHGLLREAEGRDSPAERGLVPMGDGRWYEVHVPSLMTVPHAADYSVGDGDDQARRKQLAIIGSLLVALVLGMWLTWPRSTPVPGVAARDTLTLNGASVETWEVRGVTLVAADGSTTALPVTATTDQQWPDLRQDAGPNAYWRSSALLPLELCVPYEQLLRATTVRLLASGPAPDRVYRLVTTPPPQQDLLIEACSPQDDALVRYGSLASVQPLATHQLTQTIQLGDARTLSLRDVQVVGPDQDVTLPAGQVRIVLRVEAPADSDWSALAPTLTLATGNALLPGEHVSLSDGVELRYLVPAFALPLDAVWTIAAHTNEPEPRWRLILQPPPGRLATLRQVLHVTTLTARPEGSALRLVIQLRNSGSASMLLVAEDLALEQGGARLVLPRIDALRSPLAPGETRTLETTIPDVHADQPVVVTVGAERYSIQWR